MGSRLKIALVVGGAPPRGARGGPHAAEPLPAEGAGSEEALPRVSHRLRADAEEAVRPHRRPGRVSAPGCHSPHVSVHGKLLSDDTRQICARCHDSVVPANAKSAHKVVADGECSKCHDPHASDNAANLLAKGNDLCVGCHKELGAAIAKAKFKHNPVEQGCLTCHDPHGSDQSVQPAEERGARAVRELPQGGQPGLRRAAHEIPRGQGVVHVLPRPARLGSAGAVAEQRASPGQQPDVHTSATRPRIPPRRSPRSGPATNSARGVTATW